MGELTDTFVRDELWPFLREHGFKRQRTTFNRRTSDTCEVINVQSSQFNSSGDERFYLNYGVYRPDVATKAGASPISGFVVEYKCQWRARYWKTAARLGTADQSWNLPADNETLGRELRVAIQGKVFQDLAGYKSSSEFMMNGDAQKYGS